MQTLWWMSRWRWKSIWRRKEAEIKIEMEMSYLACVCSCATSIPARAEKKSLIKVKRRRQAGKKNRELICLRQYEKSFANRFYPNKHFNEESFSLFFAFSQYQLQISSDTSLRAVYCKISFFRCLRFFQGIFFLQKRVKEKKFSRLRKSRFLSFNADKKEHHKSLGEFTHTFCESVNI